MPGKAKGPKKPAPNATSAYARSKRGPGKPPLPGNKGKGPKK